LYRLIEDSSCYVPPVCIPNITTINITSWKSFGDCIGTQKNNSRLMRTYDSNGCVGSPDFNFTEYQLFEDATCTLPLTIEILSPTNNSVLNTNKVYLEISANKNLSSANYLLYKEGILETSTSLIKINSTNFYSWISSLTNGNYQVSVTGIDEQNNTKQTSVNFRIEISEGKKSSGSSSGRRAREVIELNPQKEISFIQTEKNDSTIHLGKVEFKQTEEIASTKPIWILFILILIILLILIISLLRRL
jgi:hypothetical protein